MSGIVTVQEVSVRSRSWPEAKYGEPCLLCYTSAWEVEAGGSGVKGQACLQLRIPGQPGLHETMFK